jgi:antitoxin component of RelBE/YafQ-DinJ toxin-antitoxin module
VARARVVCFRVEEEVWERFKKLAYSYGLKSSQLLRVLVRSAVSTAEPRGGSKGRKDDSAL